MPNGNGNDRTTTLSFQKKQSALSNIQIILIIIMIIQINQRPKIK